MAFFSYQGRMARFKYFLTFLIIAIPSFFLLLGIILVSGLIFKFSTPHQMLFASPGILLIWIIFSFPNVKRLHDIGLPGWLYVFLLLSPIFDLYHIILPREKDVEIENIIIGMDLFILFLLFFIKGTKGSNKYGTDPLENK